MRRGYESVFILSGYLSGMLLLGLHTWITFKAFFSDSKSITIYVNRYGEQYGDVLTFVFFWALCLIGLVLLYKRVKTPDGEKLR